MENKEKKMLTTEDLNRTLGKKELYSIAFGHVIGSGVFSLIGIGIGYTASRRGSGFCSPPSSFCSRHCPSS